MTNTEDVRTHLSIELILWNIIGRIFPKRQNIQIHE